MASGMTAPNELPDDIAELKAIIRAQQDQNARLEALVASFKKALFGAKSEKIDPAQYELELEDIEMAIAQVEAEIDADCCATNWMRFRDNQDETLRRACAGAVSYTHLTLPTIYSV